MPGIAIFAIVYFGYQYRERERADAMREQILATHEQHLRSIADRYRELRGRLEGWVMEAANAGEPERYVDPRLRISGLHGGEGLYLRILATDATSPEGIERGARAMSEDAITRCLGIAPSSARGFYESGQFLMPQFVDDVRAETSFMRLRVIDDQLARSVSVDVPVVSTLLRSQYFLLVVQQGESRRDAPVDVYLWDLREQRQLLRTRVQGRGILLPVRLRFEGVQIPPAEGHPSVTSPGAFDCSIAAQIKAMTGEPPIFVGSDVGDTLERIEAAETATEGAAAEGTATPEGSAAEGTALEGSAVEGTAAAGTTPEGAAAEGSATPVEGQ